MYVPLWEVFSTFIHDFLFEPFYGLKFCLYIYDLPLTVTKEFFDKSGMNVFVFYIYLSSGHTVIIEILL